MEALFSAAVGELVSRCLSFLISRYPSMPELSKVESLRKLERALLRIAITVEEAEGRLITNKAMLQQLKMLRREMRKGYYVFNKFRYLDQEEEGKAEMEQTIYFLLQKDEPPGEFSLGVLPIIGRGKVGKSTLVEHVCYDVRVRHHFSQIVLFSGNKFIEEKLGTLMNGGIIKHKSNPQNDGKILVIVELDEDVEEGAWRRLLSASRSCLPSGSKIIVTSRSEKTVNFGTTQALRLNFLTREACWYFFKVLVFGSTYAEDQPKLTSIAMEIFEEYYCQDDLLRDFTGSFANSKNIAAILRANASTQHWRRILACVSRNWQPNLLPCSTDTNDVRVENGHYYISRISNISQYVLVDRRHRIVGFDHKAAPKITIDEVMYGRVTPKGKFEAVWWRSHLPPHYSYITTCEIHYSKCTDGRENSTKKRKSLS
ncbi:hypothetical protein C2845_PM05G19730 [Panicum miliaceum]|uniref:NB-ARC domain-containing protein n=1 Tax=Panicum miliaceum TaxID=4540 RepID=A0A3L6T114_PANMI|nr:hypothetical protein C2845_PM05G19730 [Panicum miliaceum]